MAAEYVRRTSWSRSSSRGGWAQIIEIIAPIALKLVTRSVRIRSQNREALNRSSITSFAPVLIDATTDVYLALT